MRDRSQLISDLLNSRDSRASYIRSKVGVLISSQLYALRSRQDWTQKQFADEADMKQPRISAMEQPGAVNFNLETLVRSAATLSVGLIVKFVPFSEMLAWENNYKQDTFNPAPLAQDRAFLQGRTTSTQAWEFGCQTIFPFEKEESANSVVSYVKDRVLYAARMEDTVNHV